VVVAVVAAVVDAAVEMEAAEVTAAEVEVEAAAAVVANNPDTPGEVAAAETTKTGPLNSQERLVTEWMAVTFLDGWRRPLQCWPALSLLFSSIKLFVAAGAVADLGAVAVADPGAVMAEVAVEVVAAAEVVANNPDAPGGSLAASMA